MPRRPTSTGVALELCREHGIGDFDLAYAYEALARARGLAGDADTAAGYLEQARQTASNVADTADRELLLSDLDTLPQATPR